MRFSDPNRWAYLAHGALRRFAHPRRCPCCGNSKTVAVDRKFFHTLEECCKCGILFRFPYDSIAELTEFYQHEYSEPGITTELPSPSELHRLMTSRFKGSQKDFADVISLLQAVGIKPGDSVLDYGANWGYGTWQFTAAGYRAVGYEISKARAEFGANLGLKIETDKARIVGLFDAVYSGHVLEHVPNPISAVREQLQWTRRGGYVIAHTPNGSLRRRELDFKSVHKNWGQVHPFLLTETFVTRNFGQSPLFVSSTGNEEEVQHWDNDSVYVGKTGGSTLLFILKKA